MLTPTCFMVDIMVYDIPATIIPMLDMDLATMARGLLMLNLRLMLTPTFFMVDITDLDIMDSDMYITDTLMLTMARGLLMLSPRLKLILTSSMVDITGLVMQVDFTILPMVVMDTMDSVDTVVMVDMDLDVVSTLDKQRISPH